MFSFEGADVRGMFASVFRKGVRRPIHLIANADQCQSVVERLLSSGPSSVAVDCEGTALGRFGSLALVQMATEHDIYLVDVVAGGRKIMDPLSSLLESREVTKVFHDCREDSSILLHQHNTMLANVFDTQVAHGLWLERKGLVKYQAGLAEVLRTFQKNRYRAHRWDEIENTPIASTRWSERPLPPAVLRYAVEGVAHLLPVQRAMCQQLGEGGEDLVVQRSANYVEYANLNAAEFASPDLSGLRPGAPLSAMLASRRPDSAYFKLNHTNLKGAVLDGVDLQDFQDLLPGDVVTCRVKFLSECKEFVHLQREGHGHLFYDTRQREMRRLPSHADVEKVFPSSRGSSLYGFGRSQASEPSILVERASYKEQKSEVIHKIGKRGALKFRDVKIQTPKPKRTR